MQLVWRQKDLLFSFTVSVQNNAYLVMEDWSGFHLLGIF